MSHPDENPTVPGPVPLVAMPCYVPASSRAGRWGLAIVGLGLTAAIAALWWIDPRRLHLPLCTFYALTGWYCPGCGATRATHALLHGQWLAALHDNALWIGGLPLYAYLAASEMRQQFRGRPLPGDLSRRPWLWAALGLLTLLFAVARNLPGHPWTLLTP